MINHLCYFFPPKYYLFVTTSVTSGFTNSEYFIRFGVVCFVLLHVFMTEIYLGLTTYKCHWNNR